MKTGKVSEAVLNRSILREIKYQNQHIVEGPGSGADASVIELMGQRVAVVSNPVTVNCENQAIVGISRVLNDVAAKGAAPAVIMAVLLLPTGYTEKHLKELMRDIDWCCREHDVVLAGGHTEVTPYVNAPCVTFTCIGEMRESATLRPKPGQELYMVGPVGLEGAYILARQKKKEILERYTQVFYEKCCVKAEELFQEKAIQKVLEHGAAYVHNLSTGGVQNGMWELAAYGNVGLDVDLKAIPVRQEIIELCELFELNPYQLSSGGSFLMTIENSCDIVNILRKHDIEAHRIGCTTDRKERILRNEDEERFMEEPKPDELLKIFSLER